jgi:hypothetical protein
MGSTIEGAFDGTQLPSGNLSLSPLVVYPFTDQVYLINLEAGLRRFPPWMLGTLYEALESLRRKPNRE